MALNVDSMQAVKMGLSSLNVGNVLGLIVDATVNGANTYAVFRARVAANIGLATTNTEYNQAGNIKILDGLDQANALSILSDTNLNSKTTVAQLQALFTAEDSSLPLTYAKCLPQ